MRRCLAMGADRAIRVDEALEAGDPISVARALADGRAARERRPRALRGPVARRRAGGDGDGAGRAPRPAPRGRRHDASTRTPAAQEAVVERELEGGLVDGRRGRDAGRADDPDRHQRAALRDLRAIKQARAGGGRRLAARRDGGTPAYARAPDVRARAGAEGAEMIDGSPAEIAERIAAIVKERLAMSVLVVAEHLRGQVRDVTLELITAGRELGPGDGRGDRRGSRARSSLPSTSRASTRSCPWQIAPASSRTTPTRRPSRR